MSSIRKEKKRWVFREVQWLCTGEGRMSFESNLATARAALAQFEGGVTHRIGGVDVGGAERFETVSPVDGQVLAKVARGGAAEIDAAVKAAEQAFADWRRLPGKERRALLHRVADGIEARAEEIALVESLDTGQAIRFMAKAAVRGAANFRFYADKAPEAQDGQSLLAPGQMNVTHRRPIGPVGVITPWNTPFMLSTWKIAPALAAGCTVVHKPAEFSPLTAKLLVEIAEEAGLPPGVLNTVNGFGEDCGKALTEHPGIKAVAFVGESQTGSHIMRQGAATLKRVHFELGGKNPVIVFEDADLERAVDAAVFMIYSLNGERCTSSSRLLVQESVYEEVCARVAERAKAIKVGHPLDPETVVGPLIHPVHEAKVLSYFEAARAEGAVIAAGGEKVGAEGCYVAPTLFTNATNDMRIAREEIFGPVLTAIPFRDEAEALRLANDTEYGLTAYLWTSDVTRAMRMTQELQAGMMWVNSENLRHLPTPFGGMKASGIGRDGGDWSFDFYMETVNVCFATGDHRIPKLGA
jgi:5-carboxymethyl-2-hydroxymuconic-semialdehyde dehydrogenase